MWSRLHQHARASRFFGIVIRMPIYRIQSFERVGTYMLKLDFDDGSCRTIDFEPILIGELFGPLRDPRLFAQVTLDPEVQTIVWPTSADFDPATLHDWP